MAISHGSKVFKLPSAHNWVQPSRLSFIEPQGNEISSVEQPPTPLQYAQAIVNAYASYADFNGGTTIYPTTGDILVSTASIYYIWCLEDCYDTLQDLSANTNGIYTLLFSINGVIYLADQLNGPY
jgi:hypothetical protein